VVTENIRRTYNRMFDAEKKAADYILQHPEKVLEMNISELARNSGTSDATVIRMCKHIGYTGFQQMKIHLASESGTRQFVNVSDQTAPKDVVQFFSQVAANITDSAKNVDMAVLLEAVELLASAEQVYLCAWGNSGAIASDMALRLGRIGIKAFYTQNIEYTFRSINIAGEKDVLVAISHSGTSIPVIQAIELARKRGLQTMLITDSASSKAAELSDLVLRTAVKNQLFYDLGGVSHVFEYVLVDAILYFLKDKNMGMEMADEAEAILSQYKL
jgi:RpiR family carbohydrate utilization transcriptional regulator